MDTHPICSRCGRDIDSETMIILLLKQTLKLSEKVEQLELERGDRENIKYEEERIKMVEEIRQEKENRIAQENINKDIERFKNMDL